MNRLVSYFERLPDPRIERTKAHELLDQEQDRLLLIRQPNSCGFFIFLAGLTERPQTSVVPDRDREI